MSWWTYVERIARTDRQRDISERTGIDPSNISRWKGGAVPKADVVAQFARAYERPVLESFVAAGFLTEVEARQRPTAAPSLESLTDEELVAEITRRLRSNTVLGRKGIGKTGQALAAYPGTPDTEAVTAPQDEIEAGSQDVDDDMEPR